MAWAELGIARCCKAIPGTDQLAVVAAVYAVADRLAKLDGDRPFVLNGQIADAAAGINPVSVGRRAGDGAGGAVINTTGAVAAVWRDGAVFWQGQVAQNLAEKTP